MYKLKPLVTGKYKYKARLVAQGYSQRPGKDYDEIFSPTAKGDSVRLILTLGAKRKLLLNHFDIQTAYLHASISEDLYLAEPPGYETGSNRVLKLNKALYGLKQAARSWNKCFHEALVSFGFKQSTADNCVYVRGTGSDQEFCLIYVDDVLYACKTDKQTKRFAKQLSSKFKVKDLGPVRTYLGLEVCWAQDGSCLISQQNKVKQLLTTYRMQDCKGAAVPMDPGFIKTLHIDESPEFEHPDVYHSVIGSLLYLAQWSRPDISYAVGILSRLVSKPTLNAWKGVKQVLRYLKQTIGYMLQLNSSEDEMLSCYCDSDWGNLPDRKSVTGLVIMVGGALISWRSRKQDVVSVSSTESEYAALSELCNEVIYFKHLLADLNVNCGEPVRVYIDNQACITLSKTEGFKSRSKHISVKYQNVRCCVQDNIITCTYVSSEENVADVLTKPLAKIKNKQMCKGLGLLEK